MGQNTLKDLGEELKLKRKERNLSLKEAENATSIRQNYLQAIEEGEVSKLISPVYAQGFIKQYASYLGVDSDSLFKVHPDAIERLEPQEFSYGIGTLEVRANPGSSVKWVPNAFWFLTLAGVLAAAYFFASYLEVI